eukprot:1493101-Amphidinium_carterae.3
MSKVFAPNDSKGISPECFILVVVVCCLVQSQSVQQWVDGGGRVVGGYGELASDRRAVLFKWRRKLVHDGCPLINASRCNLTDVRQLRTGVSQMGVNVALVVGGDQLMVDGRCSGKVVVVNVSGKDPKSWSTSVSPS